MADELLSPLDFAFWHLDAAKDSEKRVVAQRYRDGAPLALAQPFQLVLPAVPRLCAK